VIVRPFTLKEANAFVTAHHRHNKAVVMARFSLAAVEGDEVVGVVIVTRPLARALDDGLTAEVARLCVKDDAPRNACSFLYGAARRVWSAMGGKKILTYTLQSESGASLRGAGWELAAALKKRKADGWATRPGRIEQAVVAEPKYRWECAL